MSKFTSTSKTIQLKKNATLEDFNFWSTKYFAIANAEEFADIMTGDEELSSVAGNSDKESNFKKCNKNGWAHLLLSVNGIRDSKIISDASSTDFPKGCLHTAWKKLNFLA